MTPLQRAAEFEQHHRLYKRVFGRLHFMQDGIPGDPNELRVLREIAAVSDGLPINLLAQWLGLGPSLVSHLMARLQRQGLAECLGVSYWDGRIKLFAATRTGTAVAKDYTEEVQLCAQRLLATFHPVAQGRILAAMRQVGRAIATRRS